MEKKYRVFYHYYKQQNCMSVHFKKTCTPVKDVVCNISTETKWNKRQPMLIVQGFATEVIIKNNIAYIN